MKRTMRMRMQDVCCCRQMMMTMMMKEGIYIIGTKVSQVIVHLHNLT